MMAKHPRDYEPFRRGDGRRFHVRVHDAAREWQVYGLGLLHICFCNTEEKANMVADALEEVANTEER